MNRHIQDFTGFSVNEAKAPAEGVDRKKIKELMIEDVFSQISYEELVGYLDDKMIDELGRMHDRLMDDIEEMIDKGKFDKVKTKEDAEKAVKKLKGKF